MSAFAREIPRHRVPHADPAMWRARLAVNAFVPMELLPEESVEPAHSGKGNIEISGVVDLRGRPLCPYERAPSNPHCDAPSLVATVYIFLNFGIAFKAVGRSLT